VYDIYACISCRIIGQGVTRCHPHMLPLIALDIYIYMYAYIYGKHR